MTLFDYAHDLAQQFGFGLVDIRSKSREKSVTFARWYIISELRDRGLSLKQIGRVVNRDHTTILHALREF